jgi:ribosome biogenesis protein MAK21
MQPLAVSEPNGLLSVTPAGQQSTPVNTENFKAQKEENVAAEDVFFHKYFNSLGKEKSQRKAKSHQDAGTGTSAADEGESEIWKAIVESAPDLEGVDDWDDDIEMEDLESDFERSMDDLGADSDEDDEDTERMERSSSDGLGDGLMMLGEDASDDEGLVLASMGPSEPTKPTKPNKERRKKIKGLPTFASASDYARILDDDDGEELG